MHRSYTHLYQDQYGGSARTGQLASGQFAGQQSGDGEEGSRRRDRQMTQTSDSSCRLALLARVMTQTCRQLPVSRIMCDWGEKVGEGWGKIGGTDLSMPPTDR